MMVGLRDTQAVSVYTPWTEPYYRCNSMLFLCHAPTAANLFPSALHPPVMQAFLFVPVLAVFTHEMPVKTELSK